MSILKTHIEFRSESFPKNDIELSDNDGSIWGYTLAVFLSGELQKNGLQVFEFICEDWGYLIPLASEDLEGIWIGCTHYEEFENGFLVFIEPSNPIVKKGFFRKIDISEKIIKVSNVLDKILTNNPNIYAQRWWGESDMKLIAR